MLKPASWYKEFEKDFIANSKNYLRLSSEVVKYGKEKVESPKIIKKIKKEFSGLIWPLTDIQVVPDLHGEEGHGYGILLGQTAYIVYRLNSKKIVLGY